jgi:hypothetical protein
LSRYGASHDHDDDEYRTTSIDDFRAIFASLFFAEYSSRVIFHFQQSFFAKYSSRHFPSRNQILSEY